MSETETYFSPEHQLENFKQKLSGLLSQEPKDINAYREQVKGWLNENGTNFETFLSSQNKWEALREFVIEKLEELEKQNPQPESRLAAIRNLFNFLREKH